MEYKFYYDESEHSRKINYKTITAENYYDNFIAVIVGWKSSLESVQETNYKAFEEKYKDRASHGELKSTTIKQEQLRYGFASLNKQNIQLLNDFFDLFSEDVYIFFSVLSKMEYIVGQIFEEYENSLLGDMDKMKYSIIKAILKYRPEAVLNSIYNKPYELVDELRKFFLKKIEQDKQNVELKKLEIEAFEEIVVCLDEVQPLKRIDWDYEIAFHGYQLFLSENHIKDYTLVLDKEGEQQNTLKAAKKEGIKNVVEENSKDQIGIRMADMLSGILSKMMKSLSEALLPGEKEGRPEKKMLDQKWFSANTAQISLYKKLYHIITELNNTWYKSFAGIYADDLVFFMALLEYMSCYFDAKNAQLEMQAEYFNTFACQRLKNRFERMSNKLPVAPIPDLDKEYFLNRRGGKIYFDIKKQPLLKITVSKKYKILSVGWHKAGVPIATISENKKITSYVLPDSLNEWAEMVIGWANMGMNLFPADVIFSEKGGKYYAEIL